MQRFTIMTLIDVTETRQYRHQAGDDLAKLQQQNFSALIQTIGLRANPIYQAAPTVAELAAEGRGFGSKFQGSHRIWQFEFGIEYEGGFTDQLGDESGLLAEDLNFVPVITGLTETADLRPPVFNTKSDQDRNTIISVDGINNIIRQ